MTAVLPGVVRPGATSARRGPSGAGSPSRSTRRRRGWSPRAGAAERAPGCSAAATPRRATLPAGVPGWSARPARVTWRALARVGGRLVVPGDEEWPEALDAARRRGRRLLPVGARSASGSTAVTRAGGGARRRRGPAPPYGEQVAARARRRAAPTAASRSSRARPSASTPPPTAERSPAAGATVGRAGLRGRPALPARQRRRCSTRIVARGPARERGAARVARRRATGSSPATG